MTHVILAETTASVSELKQNPMKTVAAGEGFPVAILNRNEPIFYCIPAKAYEALMNKLEDRELNAIADARLKDGKKLVQVKLDEHAGCGIAGEVLAVGKRESNAVYRAVAKR